MCIFRAPWTFSRQGWTTTTLLTDSSRPQVVTKEAEESSQEEQRSNSRIARRVSATWASRVKRSRIHGGSRGRTQPEVRWSAGRSEQGQYVKYNSYVGDVKETEAKLEYFSSPSRLTSPGPNCISREPSCGSELGRVAEEWDEWKKGATGEGEEEGGRAGTVLVGFCHNPSPAE